MRSHHPSELPILKSVGLGSLLIGSMILALAICTTFTLLWVGLPRTTSLPRTLALASLGAVLGPIGYRLASGTWHGSWQVPSRAAALGALLFLGYVIKAMLLSAHRPHPPPGWMWATAGLALVSWCVAACCRRKYR